MTKTEARNIIKSALDAGQITWEKAGEIHAAISSKTHYGNPMTPRAVESIIRRRYGL